ncbi:MAG: hypothetical protein AAGF85_13500 [Bacteroidota bacterium]
MPSKFTVHSTLFLVALFYGANYSIAKIALSEYAPPFGFILLGLIVATGLFWLLGLFKDVEKVEKGFSSNVAFLERQPICFFSFKA